MPKKKRGHRGGRSGAGGELAMAGGTVDRSKEREYLGAEKEFGSLGNPYFSYARCATRGAAAECARAATVPCALSPYRSPHAAAAAQLPTV